MPNGFGTIIIEGGSVELKFHEEAFHKEPTDKVSKFSNRNRRIVRVHIKDEADTFLFDSGEKLDGLKWTIEIQTKD